MHRIRCINPFQCITEIPPGNRRIVRQVQGAQLVDDALLLTPSYSLPPARVFACCKAGKAEQMRTSLLCSWRPAFHCHPAAATPKSIWKKAGCHQRDATPETDASRQVKAIEMPSTVIWRQIGSRRTPSRRRRPGRRFPAPTAVGYRKQALRCGGLQPDIAKENIPRGLLSAADPAPMIACVRVRGGCASSPTR